MMQGWRVALFLTSLLLALGDSDLRGCDSPVSHASSRNLHSIHSIREEDGEYGLLLQASVSGTGLYYLDTAIGCPEQHFALLLDTMRSNIFVPSVDCEDCVVCTSPSCGTYNESASTTAEPFICGVNCSKASCDKLGITHGCGFYSEDLAGENTVEYRGALWRDYLSGPLFPLESNRREKRMEMWGGEREEEEDIVGRQGIYKVAREPPPGCESTDDFGLWVDLGSFEETNQGEEYPPPITGSLGVGLPSLAISGTTSLLESVQQQSASTQSRIGMCLCPFSAALTFGSGTPMSPCEGVDVGAVQWSPILQRISYNLYVGDILVNNISVTATSAVRNPLVLDTTHRDILVTPLLYTILQRTMLGACVGGSPKGLCDKTQNIFNGFCFYLSDTDLALYPVLDLQLEGAYLSFDHTRYLIVRGGRSCLAMRPLALDGIVLGTLAMQAHYTILSPVSGEIGFAPISCSDSVYTITAVSGSGQSGLISTQLSDPFVVQVLLTNNTPAAGVTVTFNLAQGAGSLSSNPVTDANGIASTRLRFGVLRGEHVVVASVPFAATSPILFFATCTDSYWASIVEICVTALLAVFVLVAYLLTGKYLKRTREEELEDVRVGNARNWAQESGSLQQRHILSAGDSALWSRNSRNSATSTEFTRHPTLGKPSTPLGSSHLSSVREKPFHSTDVNASDTDAWIEKVVDREYSEI